MFRIERPQNDWHSLISQTAGAVAQNRAADMQHQKKAKEIQEVLGPLNDESSAFDWMRAIQSLRHVEPEEKKQLFHTIEKVNEEKSKAKKAQAELALMEKKAAEAKALKDRQAAALLRAHGIKPEMAETQGENQPQVVGKQAAVTPRPEENQLPRGVTQEQFAEATPEQQRDFLKESGEVNKKRDQRNAALSTAEILGLDPSQVPEGATVADVYKINKAFQPVGGHKAQPLSKEQREIISDLHKKHPKMKGADFYRELVLAGIPPDIAQDYAKNLGESQALGLEEERFKEEKYNKSLDRHNAYIQAESEADLKWNTSIKPDLETVMSLDDDQLMSTTQVKFFEALGIPFSESGLPQTEILQKIGEKLTTTLAVSQYKGQQLRVAEFVSVAKTVPNIDQSPHARRTLATLTYLQGMVGSELSAARNDLLEEYRQSREELPINFRELVAKRAERGVNKLMDRYVALGTLRPENVPSKEDNASQWYDPVSKAIQNVGNDESSIDEARRRGYTPLMESPQQEEQIDETPAPPMYANQGQQPPPPNQQQPPAPNQQAMTQAMNPEAQQAQSDAFAREQSQKIFKETTGKTLSQFLDYPNVQDKSGMSYPANKSFNITPANEYTNGKIEREQNESWWHWGARQQGILNSGVAAGMAGLPVSEANFGLYLAQSNVVLPGSVDDFQNFFNMATEDFTKPRNRWEQYSQNIGQGVGGLAAIGTGWSIAGLMSPVAGYLGVWPAMDKAYKATKAFLIPSEKALQTSKGAAQLAQKGQVIEAGLPAAQITTKSLEAGGQVARAEEGALGQPNKGALGPHEKPGMEITQTTPKSKVPAPPSKLDKAVQHAMGRNLKTVVASEAAKAFVDSIGLKEEYGDSAKLMTWLGMSFAGISGKKFATDQLKVGKAGFTEKDIVDSQKLSKSVFDSVKNTLNSDRTADIARTAAQTVLQDIENGNVSVPRLMKMIDNLNGLKKSKGMFEIPDSGQRKSAAKHLDNVIGAVKSVLYEYGHAHDPESIHLYQNAMKSLAIIHETERLTNMVSNATHGKMESLYPLCGKLFSGVAFSAGAGAASVLGKPLLGAFGVAAPFGMKTVQVLERCWKDPNLSKYYFQAVKHMAEKDIPAFFASMDKLETSYKKKYEDKKILRNTGLTENQKKKWLWENKEF